MYDRYVIKSGDNLGMIARQFATDTDTIRNINNLYYDDPIRVGMEIIVPKGGERYFEYYVIKQGDTLYGVSQRYNINPELLANMNGLDMNDYIYPGQEILIPKSGYSYYITKQGDTLSSVSELFKNTVDNIIMTNQTIYLLEGQLLVNKTR